MRLKGKNILISGGYGRLGVELVPLLKEEGAMVMAPSHMEWDINLPPIGLACPVAPDIIIHAAAYTNVSEAETQKADCWLINVEGTQRVSKLAYDLGAKLVYISSDYVNVQPMGFYATTKSHGETFVSKSKGLVIRTSFKSHGTWGKDRLKSVFHPVHTNADWVDIIAKKVVNVICKGRTGVVNVGTKRKTLKDLALQEYPEVIEVPVEQADGIVGYVYPRDTCMKGVR